MGRQRILLVDDNQPLVVLLARTLESEGFVPILALRGRQALEKIAEEPPDAAVVDVLLPDMMGYEVAAALRKLRVPFVFITGVFKGGRAATEAAMQHGASGYFEKPFDAKRLVQALRKLLPSAPAEEEPEQIEVEPIEAELLVSVEPEEPVDPMELTGRVEVMEGGKLQSFGQTQPLRAAPVEPAAPPSPARPAAPPPPPHEPLGEGSDKGELRNNFPELVTAFWLTQQSGELVVERGNVRKVVWFENGRPVYAASNLASDRFGTFLQRVGKVTAAQLAAAMVIERPGRRVGDAFVELGYLQEKEKVYFLAQQVKAIIYSLFGWEEGRFRIEASGRIPRDATHIEVHPAHLITRGVKKLYKPERLRRMLTPADRLIPTQQPAYGLHDVILEIWEAQLLPQVNGSRTVADIISLAGRSEPEVLAFLWTLVALQILEKRG